MAFPDSDIAKKYSCGRTKTSCIINGILSPAAEDKVVNDLQTAPFTQVWMGAMKVMMTNFIH